jgi:PAS domain S-box-containing protein
MTADVGFGQLFERSSDPVFVLDPLGNRILAANPAASGMLGYTRGELLETPVSRIHPADLAQLQDLVERVLRSGHGTTVNMTCRTKAGVFLPTEMSLLALDNDGRTVVLGLVHDRSEHRQPHPAD